MADTRLFVLLARETPKAVVFRRGPSRWVQLLTWNTATDAFEAGQWLKGRIYERRCDLTPDGDLLVYFAANYHAPYFSWTAVSRPPYLSALALWPKGDGWGGGGHFDSATTLALNHRAAEMTLAGGFELPSWLTVRPFGEYAGGGEDDPIWPARLARDGWVLASAGRVARKSRKAKVWIELDPPIVWEKRHPLAPERYVLQMTISGLKEMRGTWYVTEHRVLAGGAESIALGRTEWADWGGDGHLLFSAGSSLYRLPFAGGALAPQSELRTIIDLAESEFAPREAPPDALRWPEG